MRVVLGAFILMATLAAARQPAMAQPPAGAPEAPLRWGADAEGGGPYVYPDDADPSRLIGFEVDLAEALADELGRDAKLVQGLWDQLPAMLMRGDCDIVLNGYEYTPERAQRYLASIPYYIYELDLAARKGDDSINGWDDLKTPAKGNRRRTISVLSASAADLYATEHFGDTCDILRFDGPSEAMHVVETGQVDATIQDTPILQFYVSEKQVYGGLKIIGQPVAPNYYVIFARPEDGELLKSLNTAIRNLYESGRLREIYERHGLWNEAQTRLPESWSRWDSSLQAPTLSKFDVLRRRALPMVKAAGLTVALSVISMPLAILIGLFMAIVRAWDTPALGGTLGHTSPWMRLLTVPCTLYVEVVRGTPLAFQLFVVYFVLPELGLTISAFWAGVIGLAVNYSAYEAEIFRLGVQAVPRGQMEAALSLGMSRGLAVRRIVLPQAVRIVIPATANDFIALFKDTAVCSVIAVEELSKQYAMSAKSTGMFIEMALMASVLYLLMSYPLSLLSRWLERRLKKESVH